MGNSDIPLAIIPVAGRVRVTAVYRLGRVLGLDLPFTARRAAPIRRNTQLIDISVRQYVEAVRARLEGATDFDTKRQFLLDHVDRVVYANDRIALYGSVPVNLASASAALKPV